MRFIAALLFCLLAVPAQAETWREADTAHFRIFSAGDEKSLLRFSERLEQFHALLKLATGATEVNRRIVKVRVFLVPSISEVKELAGQPGSDIAGFYSPRDEGALAVVPRVTGDGIFTGQVVLFHEYAHHYMLQYTPAAYPSWYVEGFAEIAATASFERKGAITFGKAASHRQYELEAANRYPVTSMVDGTYIADRARNRGWSYGDAWLLTHYLTFDDSRRGQLRAYLNAINAGRSHADAAKAFGDLTALQREVNAYLSARNFSYRAVPIDQVASPKVELRVLGPAEAALINHTIELERRTGLPPKPGEDDDEDESASKRKHGDKPKADFDTRLAEAKASREKWIAEIEAAANRFSGEIAGWLLLADARCESEQFEACRAAASRALAIEPENGRGLIRRAEAEIALAENLPVEQQPAAIESARTAIVRAMAANRDDPLAQLAYYRSFAAAPRGTDDSALLALASAVQLVPQQSGPRLTLAAEWIARGRLREARALLRPLAYAPHQSGASRRAQAMIEEIDVKLAIAEAS